MHRLSAMVAMPLMPNVDAPPVHGSIPEVLPHDAPDRYEDGACILHCGPGQATVVVVGYGAGNEPPPFEPGAGVAALPDPPPAAEVAGEPPPAAEVSGEPLPDPEPLPGLGEPPLDPDPLGVGVASAAVDEGVPADMSIVQSHGSVTV